MVVRLVTHSHTFLHKPSAAFGVDANPRRVAWRNGIALKYPAHMMEQLGCCQHNRRIPELVKAVEEKTCILITLCRSSDQPFSGLLMIWRDIPPQEIQLAQGVLRKLISLISGGCQVGNAIANYILHERPKTQSPALFVRSRIPFDFMTSTAAGDRLRKYMKLSDVEYTPGDGKGFHSFRRYVASSMINQEVPIDIVKEILGHTQIGSMKAYMRISRDKLAMCALGLDGIEVIQEALL